MTKPTRLPAEVAAAKAAWREADEQRQVAAGSAHSLGLQECQCSGACCWRRPPRLTREDLDRLAAHLGLTVDTTAVRWCVIGRVNGVRSLMLARRHQEQRRGGAIRELSDLEMYSTESPCAWLGDDNRCTVYEGRPEECRRYRCWAPDRSRLQVGWTADELAQILASTVIDSEPALGNVNVLPASVVTRNSAA